MSSMILSGDTSGAITVTVPAVAGTNTITLPAATGTVLVSGNQPAFSAYQSSAQTALSSNTWTKLLFQTKEFDTNTNYDTSTSKFTPTVAGYYQVNVGISVNTSSSGAYGVGIYKNGSPVKNNYVGFASGAVLQPSAITTGLVYLNGTTDYVEGYGYTNASAQPNINAQNTYFQAVMVRSA